VHVRLDGERLPIFLPRQRKELVGFRAGLGLGLIEESNAPIVECFVLVRLDGERLLVFLSRQREEPVGLGA